MRLCTHTAINLKYCVAIHVKFFRIAFLLNYSQHNTKLVIDIEPKGIEVSTILL